MITSEAVNRAIDYILQHAEDAPTLEEVAEHCHFSKYYFSRLFKAQTGESVYGFIKRVRLEQSAFRLKTEKHRSITAISADYGYSSSNYSSAFRQHYQETPVSFRRNSSKASMAHPFFHHESWKAESFKECSEKITIKQMPDCPILYERRFGTYEKLNRDWRGFIARYQNYCTKETKFFERTYDDPAVTKAGNCLYDIGMSIGEDCGLENTARLQGGKCAVYHFQGHIKHIYAAYQTIFMVWLPQTRYVLDESRSVFDLYHKVDAARMVVELDICIPIM